MPIISEPQDFNVDDVYVDLAPSLGISMYLKCEGFNFSGSIKQKAAVEMVESAEKAGVIGVDSVLVESSSGNLGIALSMIAASRGYRFLCVTDSRCNAAARQLMTAYGAEVHVVTEPDPEGGLLGARLAHVRQLCAENDRYVWLNQYENPSNWRAHHRLTAPHIAQQFPQLDVLFIGAGTTGTLMGCARWFKTHRPHVRIVAVDTVGSVIFGGPARPRLIPGLGAGVRPPMLDESLVDEVVRIPETETLDMLRRLAGRGFLFGGSTGTVVAGAERWLAAHGGADGAAEGGTTAVAVSPDHGDRYLDTIYRPEWLREHYGELFPEPAAI